MKVKFNKTVSVEYFSNRLQELIDKTFYRNDVVEIDEQMVLSERWSDLILSNGDVASVPNESFEKLC